MRLDYKKSLNLGISGIILVLLLLAFSTLFMLKDYTGYLALQAKAGTITTLNIVDQRSATEWHGLYGVSVMVQSFDIQQKLKINEYGIDLLNLLFQCMEYNKDHEIYASPTQVIDWASVEPASPEFIDNYFNISSKAFDSAKNTFTKNMTVELGNRNITNIPSTFTYQNSSAQGVRFPLGILKDGNGNPIFVTKVENEFISGFSGDKINYQMMVALPTDLPITYYFFADPYDSCPEGYGELNPPANVSGVVTDKATGLPLSYVRVVIGGEMAITGTNGYYNIVIPSGDYYITAMKAGYSNYVANLSLAPMQVLVHNIQMEKSKEKIGDYTNPSTQSTGNGNAKNEGVGPGIGPYLEKPKKMEGIDHYITLKNIDKVLRIGQFFSQDNYLFNFRNKTAVVNFKIVGNVSEIAEVDKDKLIVKSNSHEPFKLTVFGKGKTGLYNGTLKLSGDFNESIPIKVLLTTKDKLPIEVLLIDLSPYRESVFPGRNFKFKIDLKNLLVEKSYNVSLRYSILDPKTNQSFYLGKDTSEIKTSLSMIKNYEIPENISIGDKILKVDASYMDRTSSVNAIFTVEQPWLQRRVFGKIPIWYIIVAVVLINVLIGLLWWVRRIMESKKRYHLKVDYKTLPQKGPPRNVRVGKIAETNKPFYFDIDKLTIHAIIAGSTGGGKTISAQVIVEECLKQGIAVIVFDPTAQWSGFLRKCKSEGMFKHYSDFGLKKEDAMAFNGNVRQIQDAREKINLKKSFKPGEILVLTTDKLDPSDIDIFVTNTVREVFHENFEEQSELKYLLIYDEVHRLLPRFGGSGEGFIQIERACREFRKWGIGVMLVSQVLSDFAAQIKANINTEIQMRTRDEEDLKRISTKYGDALLKSLVKAVVGTGMIENPSWNRGKPFFVTFRPILHSTFRLSNDELEKYNKYNSIIEDYEYQMEQLKNEGEDVFDLELELKLSLNKVKQGNFNMVDIYLEGLKPELEKRWQKINKTPVHKKIELVNLSEIRKEFDIAKKERAKFEKEIKKEESNKEIPVEKKVEDIFTKNIGVQNAISFDNGQTAMSLQELLDILGAMDDDTFKRHVNSEKNDILNWIGKEFNDEIKVCVDTTSRQEMIDNLNSKRKELIERQKQEIVNPKETGSNEDKNNRRNSKIKQDNNGNNDRDFENKQGESESKDEEKLESKNEEESESNNEPEIKQDKSNGNEGNDTNPEQNGRNNSPESNGTLNKQPEKIEVEQSPVKEEYQKPLSNLSTQNTNIPKESRDAQEQNNIEEQQQLNQRQNNINNENIGNSDSNNDFNSLKKELEHAEQNFKKKIVGAPLGEEFILKGGLKIRTLAGLIDALKKMSDEDFYNYVNNQKNDFANWILGVFQNNELANEIKLKKDKNEMIGVIEKWLG